jgi:hypothetical protein
MEIQEEGNASVLWSRPHLREGSCKIACEIVEIAGPRQARPNLPNHRRGRIISNKSAS